MDPGRNSGFVFSRSSSPAVYDIEERLIAIAYEIEGNKIIINTSALDNGI